MARAMFPRCVQDDVVPQAGRREIPVWRRNRSAQVLQRGLGSGSPGGWFSYKPVELFCPLTVFAKLFVKTARLAGFGMVGTKVAAMIQTSV